MGKYTKGPWEINEEKINSKYDNIATVNELNRIANAQLISAAPEMYEALKKIERVYIAGGEATKGDLFTLIQVMKSTAQQAIKGVE